VVVGYFDIKRVAISPDEAYPPLVIDCYGMLTGAIASQGMQAVAGWNLKIVQPCSQINIFEAADSSAEDFRWQAF